MRLHKERKKEKYLYKRFELLLAAYLHAMIHAKAIVEMWILKALQGQEEQEDLQEVHRTW